MILPPPNVTGNLHLGHAFTLTIQDVLMRYNIIDGKKISWVPGFDHAGIATQVVVEKLLYNEQNLTRHDLGKEKFLSYVEQWKTERMKDIRKQIQKLGVLVNYDKEFYTLSEDMAAAVSETFVRLYENGYIYRDSKMIGWSPYLQSTISDIETKHLTINGKTFLKVPGHSESVEFGVLHEISYPLQNSTGGIDKINVATTRLETILGDVAIAVHPQDSRYSSLIGQCVLNPLTNDLMPIIADESVNPGFGTGALKITPAHDFTDWEISKRHNLPLIDIFNEDGSIKCSDINFNGINRFVAKSLVKTILTDKGLYVLEREHNQVLPTCSRTGDVLEYRILSQWFIKCSDLGERAARDADLGYIKFFPEYHYKWWFHWLKGMQDWCISRQLWWGHSIPAWKVVGKNEEWVVAMSEEKALEKARKKYPDVRIELNRDTDILDTWFSSALLPLTVFGWPNSDLKDIEPFFPLSLMETGHDILMFWVMKMVFMSYALTNHLPFSKILLHGLICDANGKKMTKSLGNVLDPIHIIEGVTLQELLEENEEYFKKGILSFEQMSYAAENIKKQHSKGIPNCGTDALRFALCHLDTKPLTTNFDYTLVLDCKHFTNKMHQTVRFFLNADVQFKLLELNEV